MNGRQAFQVMHAPDAGGTGGTGGGEPQGADAPQGGGAEDDGPGGEGQQGGAQPQTVNRYKHEREVGRLNDEIQALKAELAAARGRGDEAEKVRADLEALRSELADEKLTASLDKAGCVNAKAAKALLGDYGGDVAKLAEACPYLFAKDAPKVGSTGGEPAPGGTKTRAEERIDSIFGGRK